MLSHFKLHLSLKSVYKHPNNHLIYGVTANGIIHEIDIFHFDMKNICYLQLIARVNNDESFQEKCEILSPLYKNSNIPFRIINPIFMAFLLDRFEAIEYILENWGYPNLGSFQSSIITLVLKSNKIAFANKLLTELTKYQKQIIFTKEEFTQLLQSDLESAKMLLVKAIEIVTNFTNTGVAIKQYNNLKKPRAKFDSKSGYFTEKYFDIYCEKEENGKKNKKNLFIDVFEKLNFGFGASETTETKELTEILRVNAQFSFQRGSDEISQFLNCYNQSQVQSFVLSKWSILIDLKWDNNIINYFSLFMVYLEYILLSVYFHFNPNNVQLLILTVLLFEFLMAYEIPLIYFGFKFQRNSKSKLIKIKVYLSILLHF